MTRVLHLAKRPLNGHPGFLAELQARHGWESKVCLVDSKETGQRPYHNDLKSTDRIGLKSYLSACNVLHLHGQMTLEDPMAKWASQQLPSHAVIIQQHYRERNSLPREARRHKLLQREYEVITAKKGALLDPNLPKVPIVVPHWRDALQPIIRRRTRLKLVFTPTTQERMLSYAGTKGKGYQETKPVLDRFAKFMDVEIISNLNWRETMTKVQEADIRLDELVTGGFGMATLEGLACGCVTITGANTMARNLLGPNCPAISSDLSSLDGLISQLVAIPDGKRQELQRLGAAWVRETYSEKILFDAYRRTYTDAVTKMGREPATLEVTPPRVYAVKIEGIVEEPVSPPMLMEAKAPTKGGKLIVQVARTNCAGAIWRIHEAINKYTEHTCRTITESDITNGRRFPRDVSLRDRASVSDLFRRADVIHFHNWLDHEAPDLRQYAAFLSDKTKVLQFHTEPSLVQRSFRRDVVKRTDIKTLTIAQKHARFYPNSAVVPNLVDINDPALTPTTQRWGGPLRVIYTPTDTKSYRDYTNTCCGKGYEEVLKVLTKLEKEGIIKATVITSMNWEELMPLKRQHDVCIDECVTGGYHLCSLESLAQGLATIAWIDSKTEDAIAQVVGRKTELPWVNTKQADLEKTLRDLAADRERLELTKAASRAWMERNWDPKVLVNRFLECYGFKEKTVGGSSCVDRRWGDNRMLPVYDAPADLNSVLELEGAWKDRTVVVWGNGFTVDEALSQSNEPWFQQAKHIGTNMAALLGIQFDAYCIGDLRFLEKPEKMKVAQTAPGCRVYASFLKKSLQGVDANYVKVIGHSGISNDLRSGVYHGYSVAWIALQVALWAGSRDILLAGCPHDYSNADKLRFYRENKPSPVDNNLHRILLNYTNAMPILKSMGVRLRTIGESRLREAGVDQQLTLRVTAPG